MDSDILRDFVIVITGGLLIVLFILMGIISFLIYRQIKALTRSIKDTMQSSKELGSEVKDAVRSTRSLVGIFTGRAAKEDCKSANNT
jgi:cell division protein FtsL